MRPLSVALVGCGKRGRVHAAALRDVSQLRLTALCDVDEHVLRDAGAQLGVERLYTDVETLVEREQPDLVDVVTRPEVRADTVERLVAAGAEHLLIEKPIALLPSDVDRVRGLGHRALIAVNTQYGWMPHWQHLRRIVREGGLGAIRRIHCSTRTNPLEQGPHVLDLALGFARDGGLGAPEWVLAAIDGEEPFADVAIPADVVASVGLGPARLHWEQGSTAAEVPGETTYFHHIQLTLVGEKGVLGGSLTRGWLLLTDAVREHGPTRWPEDDAVAQARLFVELADTIRTGRDTPFPTDVAHAAMCSDLIFATIASGQTRRRIDLPFHADDALLPALARGHEVAPVPGDPLEPPLRLHEL